MQSKPRLLTCGPRRRIVTMAIALILVTGAPPLAADPPVLQPPAVGDQTKKEGQQCEWACQKWTRLCNVDPRGVYKCRRSCAKFGQVCE